MKRSKNRSAKNKNKPIVIKRQPIIEEQEIILEPVFKTPDLEIVYPDDVYQKIMHWVRKTNLEVSGFGACKIEGSKIVIVDAFILDEGSSAETTISAEAVAKMDVKIMQMYPDYPMKLWWHSHPTFNVFWSGTDRQAMNQLSQHGWFCFTVFNQKGEYNSAVAIDAPFRILLDQVKTTFPRSLEEEKIKGWDADFQLMKDSKPKPIQPNYHQGLYNPHHRGGLRQPENTVIGAYAGYHWDGLKDEELADNIETFKSYGYSNADIASAMGSNAYFRGNKALTESVQRKGWMDDYFDGGLCGV